MYLKLHTYSGAYGFYFYNTNAEVFSKRTFLTLLLLSVKRCHTKDADREESNKQAEALSVMQRGGENPSLKPQKKKERKWTYGQ